MIVEAMDSTVISVTTENIFPDGKMQQNSTGYALPNGLLSPSKSDVKIHSRYLRPSMASCHDYCKYGKKHDSEATSQNLRAFLKKKFRERAQDHLATPCVEEKKFREREQDHLATPCVEEKKFREREQEHLATSCVEERRMRTVIKPKMETESKSESDSSEKSEFSKPKSPSLIKKNITYREKKTLPTSQYNKRNQVKNLNQDDENKTKVIKRWIPRQPKSSPDKASVINLPSSEEGASGDPDIMKGDTETLSESISSIASKEMKSPGSEAGDSWDHCIITENTKSIVSEPISSIAPKEIKSPGSEAGDSGDHCTITENTKTIVSEPTAAATPKAKNQKMAPSVEQPRKIKQKTPLPLKHVDVAARSAIVLKTKTPLTRSLSRRKSSRSLIAQSNWEKKLTESLGTSRFEGVVSTPANNLRSKAPHLRSISQLKSSISQFDRRNQEKITKTPDLSKFGEDTTTPADTLKTRTPAVKSVSKLKPSWSPSPRRNQESKITKSPSTSNIKERKLLKAPPASFDGVSSLKLKRLSSLKHAPSVKSKDKFGRTNSKKKSENSVFNRNHENEHSESATNKLSSVEIEGNNKIDSNNKIEVSRGQYKRGVRRSLTARAEENSPTTYRLKYRQRKSIDLRSDSIGARRLWLRIGTIAAEDQNSSSLSRRRSFKKKDMRSPDSNLLNSEAPVVVLKHQDVEEEAQALFRIRKMTGESPSSSRLSWRRRSFKKKKDMESSDSKLPNSEAQIVVLKHQDAEKKKEAQALFNHVIEETASKLVESRKSKVKALVGAFETVISLQERKPASAV